MPDGERTAWNDDRLDDKFSDIIAEQRAFKDIPAEVAKLSVDHSNLKADVNRLGTKLNDYIQDQRDTERDRIRDRVSDRRWLIGTVLTSAGLIIAALGLLLGKF